MAEREEITRLLHAWRDGDRESLDRLMPLVYDELRVLAASRMRAERDDHTLRATALVHETFLRLVAADVTWHDRVHFFALTAGMMRRVLVDHAKTRHRAKRGGGARRISLDDATLVASGASDDLLALDESLHRLSTLDERKARAIELHYFGGLSHAEVAEALGVSEATVDRDLRFAKAWLSRDLQEGDHDD
jgi:RNA polymerase sigma factor (TIGR02999 family)